MVAAAPTPLQATKPPLQGTKRRRAASSDSVVTIGRSRTGTFLANGFGLLFSLVMIFPVYWVIITAFKPSSEILQSTPTFIPEHPTLDNFISAIKAPHFLQGLTNGLIISVASVLGALVVGFLAALAIARFKFYGRRALILVILAVQLVPLVALIIPLFRMLQGWDLTNTLTGVSLVYLVLLLPYTVWTLRGFISGIPRELDEAALIDGCSRFQTFWRIILPLTGPGLVATSVYGFIQAWNEYIIINTLNLVDKQNTMAWLAQFQTTHGTAWGPLMAGATISSIPVVIFFLVIQRNIATGLTAGAVKG